MSGLSITRLYKAKGATVLTLQSDVPNLKNLLTCRITLNSLRLIKVKHFKLQCKGGGKAELSLKGKTVIITSEE